MANRIHQLPDDLVARIAAGEVVERPASILKELLENSLDAGATHVSVAIEGAGRTRLLISDNGCGMSPADARLALKRHATSKISRYDDLETIGTFGFRGEALPSIASVSRFRLTTREGSADAAHEITLDGGKVVADGPAARERGTSIEVKDVFFNTPARFKFMKSDATERGQCLKVVEEVAFAALEAGFDITVEGGKPLVMKPRPSADAAARALALRERVAEAWGARWAQALTPVVAQSPHFAVTGLVTSPDAHQAVTKFQYLYVNRRPVQNRRLTRAVYEGFLGQLPSMRHPGFVLFLEVDPRTVDVNVHPAKREVKLTHEGEIFGFLMHAVKDALGASRHSVPEFGIMDPGFRRDDSSGFGGGNAGDVSSRAPEGGVAISSAGFSQKPAFPQKPSSPTLTQAAHDLYRPSGEPLVPELAGLRDPSILALAQIRKTYILAQSSEGLLIFDQHAAAEKVMYERLLANMKAKTPAMQMMLVPFTWETSLSVAAAVKDKLGILNAMGFAVEPFGGTTFVVKGHPAHLGDKFDLHSLLDGLSDALTEGDARRGAFEGPEHRIAAMAACKASVKAGDPLDLAGCQTILRELALADNPLTCPHGRPTVIRLGYTDLDRRFRRI